MGSRLESKSAQTRKRIESHTFDDEDGDEYGASRFGGFTDYFRRKKLKLQNLDAEIRATSDKPPIFKGIVAHINGYTQPSLNDLHTMIVAHGGGFVQYLDGKTMVTHIIASNLTPKKAVEFRRYRIVKPAWVVDSIAAGKLLPWDSYRVVDEGVGQKVLGFDNGQVVSQVNRQSKGYRDQSDVSWYTSQLKNSTDQAGPSAPASRQFMPPPPTKPNRNLPSSTSALTPTPEYDDIHDSDFEALEEANDNPELDSIVVKSPVKVIETPSDNSLQTPPPTSSPGNEAEPDSITRQPTSPTPASPDQPHGVKRAHSSRSVSPRKAAKLTAEEHNAILLADPRVRKSTVLNPEFLDQYYRESRLHHLSTWKADLKAQLQALAAEKSSSQKARQKQPSGARRYVMHVDFDSFFAAVSLKNCPEFKDKPAAVAHGPGPNSEIASCNYPARKFGVSNGMWMKRALEVCPDLKVLPYDFPAYEDASRKFYDAILNTGGIVQSVSIDEALVDISSQCITFGGTDGVRRAEGSNFREQSKADHIAQQLRDKVLELTGCNVSVGIGGNILLAKTALRKAKPAGQFQLKPEEVLDFIGNLEVQSLPGVAYSIGGKLEEIGIKFVKDVREVSKEKLINTLGPKTGEKIWDYARGIDRTEVGDQVVRKSVSADVNWGVRFENQEQVDEFMDSLCNELHKRLVKENVKGRQLTVKIMRRSPDAPLDPPKHLGHGKCDTYNKSIQLGVGTNDKAVITKEVLTIMRGLGFSPGELRGIGVQMTKLEPFKAGVDGRPDGSQQRLHFKTAPPSKSKATKDTEPEEDPITDDIKTPKKPRVRDTNQFSLPEGLLNSESPSRRPINMLGTQFALPTQVDPRVLAELPEEIRAKLIRQTRPKPGLESEGRKSPTPVRRAKTRTADRVQSLAIKPPNQSQLDPEILDSLPEDVRRDVLAMYQTSPSKKQEQSVLPQSPRKNRTLPPLKKPVGRKPRGGGLFGRVTSRASNGISTLTQANFVARSVGNECTTTDTDGEASAPEIDQEFLAALPPELRKEVLGQQRSAQLRRVGGIDVRNRNWKPANRTNQQEAIDRMFQLPPRPAKPTFTVRKLTEIDDLRQAIRDWICEFGDETPYPEDVDALITYLAAVVTDEKNLDKAVKVAKWTAWVVEEDIQGGTEMEQIKQAWKKAVQDVQAGVQKAVVKRGLPEVDFNA